MGEPEKHEEEMIQTLWGDWVYATPRKRGRPAFKWTVGNSNKIRGMLALGWSLERIARQIIDPRTGKEICVRTLQRHFSRELSERAIARDKLFVWRFEMAMEQSAAGNVSANKLVGDLLEENDLALAEARAARNDKPAPEEKTEPLPKLGKKEIDQQEAEAADQDLERSLAEEAKRYAH